MKALLLCLSVSFISAGAHASENFKEQNCRNVYAISSRIMEARQIGIPVLDMMDMANDEKYSEIKKELRSLTLQAYESPRYNSKSMQEKEIGEFANSAYLECMR